MQKKAALYQEIKICQFHRLCVLLGCVVVYLCEA